MWDFGTVRHTGQTATMGRANAPPSPIAENGAYSASTASSRSSTTVVGHNGNGIGYGGSNGSSGSGSADVNKTLPRPSLEGDRVSQGTVRRAAAPVGRRDPSYEDDEYDEEEPPQDAHLDDAMHPTMLESVIMPAIASVRTLFLFSAARCVAHELDLVQMFPRVATAEARLALTNLQRAFIEAERMIPGVTDELVNEVVDSVERVEDAER